MNKVCKEYLRQVGQALHCPRRERKRLLSGLETELAEAFPAESCPAADLTAHFGPPEAMAAELQSALPEKVMANYQKGRRKKWMIATAACVVVIAILVGYLAWLGSIDVHYIVDEGIIVETDSVYEEK